MNSGSAEQGKPSFSHMTRWSLSAAVSSRKQMRPDKWRGCHIVRVGFVYLCVFSYCKYGVCSYTSSCFPVPFDLWDNWLGATRAAGRSQGDQRPPRPTSLPPFHGRNNREVNHTCLSHRLGRLARRLTRTVPRSTGQGAPPIASEERECEREGCERAPPQSGTPVRAEMEKRSKSQLFICVSQTLCAWVVGKRRVCVCVSTSAHTRSTVIVCKCRLERGMSHRSAITHRRDYYKKQSW